MSKECSGFISRPARQRFLKRNIEVVFMGKADSGFREFQYVKFREVRDGYRHLQKN
jgi:hypothetical protein